MNLRHLLRKAALLVSDVVLVNSAFILALLLRFEGIIPRRDLEVLWDHAALLTAVYVLILYAFRLYDSLWEFASLDEFALGTLGCSFGGMAFIVFGIFSRDFLPRSVMVLAAIFAAIFVVGLRVLFRVRRRIIKQLGTRHLGKKIRVMIVGAGSAGRVIVKEIQTNPELMMQPVCFIDDDPLKRGKRVSGIKIWGNRDAIGYVVETLKVDQIVIAIPTLEGEGKRDLISLCRRTSCSLKIIPGIYELINGDVSVSAIRDINIEDLLGREPVVLEQEGISRYLSGKTVLITGAGGSIGSELARQIVRFSPGRLVLFDIYENSVYDIQNELLRAMPDLSLSVRIGSIRDRKRIDMLFGEFAPDVVFHAAAHKHVPLMEDSPAEAIKNNVIGTLNLAEMADKHLVGKFVMISTDKAVNPTNVMGASKRMCEMIIQAIAPTSRTEFGAVRFGNVLGSNGSVIPLFKAQIAAGGPVTVTHKDITRYFMTIPEASQLVLQAGAYAKGGQLYILDMGSPVRIYDLAENLIRLSGFKPGHDMKVEVTGLRPGEKLYEEVLMHEEGMACTEHQKIFIARPASFDLDRLKTSFDELLAICDTGSRPAIIAKIAEIVPTYLPAPNSPTTTQATSSATSPHPYTAPTTAPSQSASPQKAAVVSAIATLFDPPNRTG